ncbi:DEAD/DEAH box helicase family protein [Acuticoccus sp.]|uniref:DEAD/DEAH box helicase family protein n=1 Tax=Acuticoccus sp. TaxID=1904378 RepID=UPI003B516686
MPGITSRDHRALSFGQAFLRLTGHEPLPWQRRLYERFCAGRRPKSIDLPTGLGKTSVVAIWSLNHRAPLPRRLVYVVDRRTVVDPATREAERLVETPLTPSADVPPISTLRGNLADNREWLADPGHPAVVVGTVDMIGSRLLFSGYGVSRAMRSFHAGLLGMDTLLVLDEAHLAALFEALLRTLEVMTGDNGVKLTTLSATGTNTPDFTLDADDGRHPVVQARVNASKRPAIREPSKPDGKTIAQQAMALCGSAPARVAVPIEPRSGAQGRSGDRQAGQDRQRHDARRRKGDARHGRRPMAVSEIPVDLANPGQVFACLGFMEAHRRPTLPRPRNPDRRGDGDVRLERGGDVGALAAACRWRTSARFRLEADGDEAPVPHVLRRRA